MDKSEIERLWTLIQHCLGFDFVFAHFDDKDVNEFYHYALDKMSDTRWKLEDEFREKFAVGERNE